jgi:hypothetical protein
MIKYKTLAEFAVARQLKHTDAVLTIDNDSISAYERGGEGDGENTKVFESDPETVLGEALSILNLPFEDV